jgi:DNA-binding response OmpR family regulator
MAERILVVEDDEDNLTIIRRLLQGANYEVAAVMSGGDALKLLQTETFDVILLDIMMPDISGLDVLQKIKAESATADLPVILVTARSSDDDLMSGYQYGADYYVTKPFTKKQLLYGINLVLGKGEQVE